MGSSGRSPAHIAAPPRPTACSQSPIQALALLPFVYIWVHHTGTKQKPPFTSSRVPRCTVISVLIRPRPSNPSPRRGDVCLNDTPEWPGEKRRIMNLCAITHLLPGAAWQRGGEGGVVMVCLYTGIYSSSVSMCYYRLSLFDTRLEAEKLTNQRSLAAEQM